MKPFIPIVFFLFSFGNLYAQWQSVDVGPGGHFTQINFKDINTGYAISAQKLIYKTTNGGINWIGINIINISNVLNLYEIFVDGDTIIIPIKFNRLIRSTNAGVNWTEIIPNYDAEITLLQKPENGNLFGVLNINNDSTFVGKSSNGGLTWSLLSRFSPPNSGITGLQMFDNNTGYLINTRGVYKTINGGINWTIQSYDSTSGKGNKRFIFLNENIGFLHKSPFFLYRTIDGGVSWDSVGNYFCVDFSFENDSIGYMTTRTTLESHVYKTTNSGINWSSIYSIPFTFKSAFVNIERFSNTILVCSETPGIFKSTDNGNSWNSFINRNNVHIQYTNRMDNFNIIGVGHQNGIWNSSDNGNTWVKNSSFEMITNIWERYFSGIGAYNSKVWATTDTGVFKSTDSGITWSYDQTFGDLNGGAVAMKSSGHGWITGFKFGVKKSIIYKTTNGGNSFDSIYSFENNNVKEISFYDNNIGFIAGDDLFSQNNFIKTTDGGNTWSSTNIGPTTCIEFINKDTIFVGGGTFNNKIYRSTNGGTTWDIVLQKGFYWADIEFFNKNIGYAISGQDSSLYFTTNGGDNWQYQNVGSQVPLFNLNVSSNGEGLIFGDYNKIYKTTNYGGTVSINEISGSIPKSFNLLQNYPNPFNPTTKIKYEVSKKEYITIKIFDIQGKQVATLLNENKNPGVYEIEYNGSELASGVYFYVMKAGNYISTKRMILLK